MKPSPKRLDLLWWISVPYLIALPLLIIVTGGNGWSFAHSVGAYFIFLGIPLMCVAGLWAITITYRVFVSHTVEADGWTKMMLCLAALATLAWGSYAAHG
jgi:hypothetical protein